MDDMSIDELLELQNLTEEELIAALTAHIEKYDLESHDTITHVELIRAALIARAKPPSIH